MLLYHRLDFLTCTFLAHLGLHAGKYTIIYFSCLSFILSEFKYELYIHFSGGCPDRVVWLGVCPFGVLPCKRDGGKQGKSQPKRPGRGSSSTTKKTFHPCSTPWCKFSIPGQDSHGHCFTCLTEDHVHDMNTGGPCLTSPPNFQQCRAIRLFLWNCEPRSLPLPVLTVDKGIMRLTLQLGSVELAHRWLANWTLSYLDHRVSC